MDRCRGHPKDRGRFLQCNGPPREQGSTGPEKMGGDSLRSSSFVGGGTSYAGRTIALHLAVSPFQSTSAVYGGGGGRTGPLTGGIPCRSGARFQARPHPAG